jgi:tRNA-Thr(GGU) m(6)t(6)A37 methyltransferase TsaA
MRTAMMASIRYESIGIIRTPYSNCAPFQAIEEDDTGSFVLELQDRFRGALERLDSFSHIYVLFHMDRARGYNGSNVAHPPGLDGGTVGLFASRSPNRPNPIGLDIARILQIEGLRIHTTGLSALDRTPLLDIKPYGRRDCRPEASGGWAEEMGLPPMEERMRGREFD